MRGHNVSQDFLRKVARATSSETFPKLGIFQAALLCGWRALAKAGQELVKERARKNTAPCLHRRSRNLGMIWFTRNLSVQVGTVLLIQHYPGLCPRAVFELVPASVLGSHNS